MGTDIGRDQENGRRIRYGPHDAFSDLDSEHLRDLAPRDLDDRDMDDDPLRVPPPTGLCAYSRYGGSTSPSALPSYLESDSSAGLPFRVGCTLPPPLLPPHSFGFWSMALPTHPP